VASLEIRAAEIAPFERLPPLLSIKAFSAKYAALANPA
jgi:hypothetical protein